MMAMAMKTMVKKKKGEGERRRGRRKRKRGGGGVKEAEMPPSRTKLRLRNSRDGCKHEVKTDHPSFPPSSSPPPQVLLVTTLYFCIYHPLCLECIVPVPFHRNKVCFSFVLPTATSGILIFLFFEHVTL